MTESETASPMQPVLIHRVVASPTAIDRATWPAQSLVVRTAPDEVMIVGDEQPAPPEDHAIVFADTSWSAAEVSPEVGGSIMRCHADWPPPTIGHAQGAVASIGVKLTVEPGRWLFLVPSAYARDFAKRVLGEGP